MKRSTIVLAGIGLLLLLTVVVTAHPHLRKSVTAYLDGGTEITVNYFTAPANVEHAKNAVVGAFSAGFGRLKVSADLDAGGTAIPAGEYTIGAIKNSDSDWTLALYPGKIQQGQTPEMDKVIQLKSEFSESHGTAEHIYFDVLPGSGSLEGKTVLVWHFGKLFLEGALS